MNGIPYPVPSEINDTIVEMDEEVVINSLGKTNYVASDRLAYEAIVVMNDVSGLDEEPLEKTAVAHETEAKDGGFWETFGKVAGIAAAFYWDNYNLNAKADTGDIHNVTYVVNSRMTSDEYQLRENAYNRWMKDYDFPSK